MSLIPSNSNNEYVPARLLDQIRSDFVEKTPRTNKKSRIAKIKDADVDEIINDIYEFADAYKMVTTEKPTILSNRQSNDLREEYERLKRVAEIAEARREEIKQMLFEHMDLTDSDGVTVNDQEFRREGGGFKDPTFNSEELKARLGNDFAKVIKVNVSYDISEEKLESYLQDHPDKIEDVRASLVPGSAKTPRLNLRDVKDDERE